MYKSIAIEVAQRNIRVNTIAPGFIKTGDLIKINTETNEYLERVKE